MTGCGRCGFEDARAYGMSDRGAPARGPFLFGWGTRITRGCAARPPGRVAPRLCASAHFVRLGSNEGSILGTLKPNKKGPLGGPFYLAGGPGLLAAAPLALRAESLRDSVRRRTPCASARTKVRCWEPASQTKRAHEGALFIWLGDQDYSRLRRSPSGQSRSATLCVGALRAPRLERRFDAGNPQAKQKGPHEGALFIWLGDQDSNLG